MNASANFAEKHSFVRPRLARGKLKSFGEDYAEWTFSEMKSLFYVGDFVLTLLSELTSKGLRFYRRRQRSFSRENFMNYFSSNCFTIGKLALAIKTLSFGEWTLTRIFMDRWRSSEMSLRHWSEIILKWNHFEHKLSVFPHIMISQRPKFSRRESSAMSFGAETLWTSFNWP